MLTAYDFPTAQLLDEVGVDLVLVGDSLGMVVQGRPNTISVTVRDMIYHGEMVCRAVQRAMVVVDLPFPVGQLGSRQTVLTASKIVKRTGCHAIKLEGGADQAQTIRRLVSAGIATMAHVGLRPQSVHALGGFRIQRDRDRLLADATAAADAGAFAVVVECVPPEIAGELTRSLNIPTIGIGAGPYCDGQVLVLHDLLGIHGGYVPAFAKQYANFREVARSAIEQFQNDVRSKSFPPTV